MAEEPGPRLPLHRSVFARLVLVMVLLAVSLLAIVSASFALLVGPLVGRSMSRLVKEYGRLLAATSPDEATARRLAERLDIQIRYEGPRGAFTTAADLPSAEEALADRGDGGPDGPAARDAYVVEAPDGGRYVFAWAHKRRMRAAHSKLLWITLVMVVGVVVTAHVVIRRQLQPLRTLHEGVARLGDGELDVVLESRARDEFGVLTDAFNRMARRVGEMVRARDQLLVDVSHELRSPLTRLKVALALLPEGERQRRMGDDVSEMEAMLSELLERERLGDGQGIEPERQDLAPILRESAAAFEDGPPGVQLRLEGGPLLVDVDGARMRTVLRNLLENGVKYSLPDSRPVEVSAGREGERVVVRVRDDGPGIPAADAARVFEPFVRLDRSRSRKTGGYGLGLSICKRIVEAHGGGIGLEGSAGRGACFVLWLPARGGGE